MSKYGAAMLTALFSVLLVSCMSDDVDRISARSFGLLEDGREVQIFTLRNAQGTSIEILDLGGIIVTINTADRA